MRRSITLLTLSMALTLTLPVAAGAGGVNSLDLDRYYYPVGTSESGSDQMVMFDDAETASRALNQDWGLYLTHEPKDWNHIELNPTDPRIGTIRFEPGLEAQTALASFDLTVPSVPPGDYLVALCSEGSCTASLGDLYANSIRVVESASDAWMLQRIDRMSSRQQAVRRRLQQARKATEGLEDGLAERSAEIRALIDDRDRLRARLRRLEAVEPPRSSALPWSVAAILFTLLVVGVVRYLRPTSRWERYLEPDEDTEPGHLPPPKDDPTPITKAYVETFDDSMWQRPKEPSDAR